MIDEQTLRQFGGLIVRLQERKDLTREEARDAYLQIWRNQQPDLQQGAFISALRAKGETLAEILGVTESHNQEWLAHCAAEVAAPEPHLGLVGVGMDSLKSINVTSGAAIVLAAAGVYVHKVGAPGMTGVSGSHEAFAVLGVDPDASVASTLRSVRECRLGFTSVVGQAARGAGMFRVLSQLRCGTTVHIAGPLGFHSSDERRKMIGVPHAGQIPLVIEVMRQMGYERGLVYCGGAKEFPDRFMDEFSTLGTTRVAELRDGQIREYQLNPEDVGLERANYADVAAAASSEDNVLCLLRVLSGKGTRAFEDLVCLNAAFGLLFMDKVSDVRQGLEVARKVVRDGAALAQLKATIRSQNQDANAGLTRLDGLLARV